MVKMTTSTKTRSKSQSTPGVPAVSGTVASTTGTAPRSPAHDRNACSRHGTRNGVIDTSTDSGRASSSSTSPTPRAGSDVRRRGRPGWRAARAARTARSGPASPAPGRRTGRPAGAAAACCPAPAPPGTSRGTRWCARAAATAYARTVSATTPMENSADEARGHQPQHPAAAVADGQADRGPAGQLEHGDQHQRPPRVARPRRAPPARPG